MISVHITHVPYLGVHSVVAVSSGLVAWINVMCAGKRQLDGILWVAHLHENLARLAETARSAFADKQERHLLEQSEGLL